jgi:hypothetical protein
MRHLKKFFKVKIIVGIGILVFFSHYSFSHWVCNTPPIIFNGDGYSQTSLDNYIIDGAGYFLEAYSNTLLLMKKIEWNSKESLKTDEVKLLVEKALKNMELAREAYANLTRTADNTPYNPGVIEKLKDFDYDAFQKDNGLNPRVFSAVKSYLVNGEIRKIYYDFSSTIEEIIGLVKQVKRQIDAGNFTPVKEIWKLNGLFSESLLFGQYVSQVLYDIQGI